MATNGTMAPREGARAAIALLEVLHHRCPSEKSVEKILPLLFRVLCVESFAHVGGTVVRPPSPILPVLSSRCTLKRELRTKTFETGMGGIRSIEHCLSRHML
jgi:hypothetical protein